MSPTTRTDRCLVVVLLLLFTSGVAEAQVSPQVYLVQGYGPPAVVAAGFEFPLGGRLALHGEAGLFGASLGGALHLLPAHESRRVDLFTFVGYSAFTDLNYDDTGVRFGGGFSYWPYRHFGFRFEGNAVALIQDEIRTSQEHWGVRGGVAVRFR